MRLVQIIESKAHWIFEPKELFGTDGILNRYPQDCVFVDITDKPRVQEGWDYNKETGEFIETVISEPTPEPIPQPTEQELINADTLLNQAEQSAKLNMINETLAVLLLNSTGGM